MRRIGCILGLCLLMLLGAVQANLSAQGTPEDDRIYDEVRRVLANDRDVKGAGLEVTVKDGTVTLEGVVDTRKALEKAPRLVKRVKGVKQVDSKLKVRYAE